MKKIFTFSKIDFNGTGRKINLVTIEAELKAEPAQPTFTIDATTKERHYTGNYTQEKTVFSVCADVWNSKQTNIIAGGQCLDELAEYVHSPLFKKIYRLWKLYHLNDMHAGTPEQEKAVKEWKSRGNKYDYTAACDYLKSIRLYEVENDGKPYKYGHAWLYYPIPENDLNEIKELLK